MNARSPPPCKKRPPPHAGCKFTAQWPIVAPSFLLALRSADRLLGLAVSRNQGKGRMLVFVTELLLALPLLLTLHAFVVFEPLGVRSHQFDR